MASKYYTSLMGSWEECPTGLIQFEDIYEEDAEL